MREVAAPDVGRMGIEILSFTIKVSEEEKGHSRFSSLHIFTLSVAWADCKLRVRDSLSRQDVYDRVEYLSSLGKTQTAAVKRDADIGVAEAERDAGIRVGENANLCFLIPTVLCCKATALFPVRLIVIILPQEAECKKEMMDVKFLADTKMADSKRELEMQKASFNQEVNTKVTEGAEQVKPRVNRRKKKLIV